MPYSFEDIMRYHPDNIDVYNEIKNILPFLVPFVGAGLTQFAYCSWPQALEILSSKITDSDDNAHVKSVIDDGRYFEAAQLLENLRGENNLARDLANLFSPSKLVEKYDDLPSEAVSLLPQLFSGLVLTTNFDQTLEKVYINSGTPFNAVLYPGQSELLNQLLQQGKSYSLFKLHGTVTGDYIEYNRIIFTEKQYAQNYGEGSKLTLELKRCLQGKTMLFLGCSLKQDRTMDVLQTIVEPGQYHYAIISCAKSDRDKKIRELERMHIRAILYEEGHHEAVRMILEHLIEGESVAPLLPDKKEEKASTVNHSNEQKHRFKRLNNMFTKQKLGIPISIFLFIAFAVTLACYFIRYNNLDVQ